MQPGTKDATNSGIQVCALAGFSRRQQRKAFVDDTNQRFKEVWVSRIFLDVIIKRVLAGTGVK